MTRQAFEGEYANYEEPLDSNGFTTLNVDKIEAIISYIAERVTNLFKVKLMKMLWYSDVLAYKINGCAMTGMVYRHNDMGALPIGHYSLMNLERLNVHEEESYNYDSMLHIYPTIGMDYDILSAEERRIQGHSIPVDVELPVKVPPEFLWHGTGEKYVESIDSQGLVPKSRLYVHLSGDVETAENVGRRHGKPVIYKVFSGKMYEDGYTFYQSVNGVWLVKEVPVRYLYKMTM